MADWRWPKGCADPGLWPLRRQRVIRRLPYWLGFRLGMWSLRRQAA